MELITLPDFLASRSCGLLRQSANVAANKWVSSAMDRACGLFGRDLRAHYGCVNAIEFSNNGGKWIASGNLNKTILFPGSYILSGSIC
jgi:hypothetical protein